VIISRGMKVPLAPAKAKRVSAGIFVMCCIFFVAIARPSSPSV